MRTDNFFFFFYTALCESICSVPAVVAITMFLIRELSGIPVIATLAYWVFNCWERFEKCKSPFRFMALPL